ncbi:hypothetical protein D3C84_863410 [compost metagenome]
MRRPCFLAKAVEQIIAAAAPQVGGQAIRRVMTPGHSTGSFITSSVVRTFLNNASGLFAAWRLALARMAAKVSMRVPYFCMCSRPAPPNIRKAPGNSDTSAVNSSITDWVICVVARGRSSQWPFRAPGCICSKPNARAHSTAPLSTAWRAR